MGYIHLFYYSNDKHSSIIIWFFLVATSIWLRSIWFVLFFLTYTDTQTNICWNGIAFFIQLCFKRCFCLQRMEGNSHRLFVSSLRDGFCQNLGILFIIYNITNIDIDHTTLNKMLLIARWPGGKRAPFFSTAPNKCERARIADAGHPWLGHWAAYNFVCLFLLFMFLKWWDNPCLIGSM